MPFPGELLGAFRPFGEQFIGGFEFIFLEENTVSQRPVDRLVVHLHIRQEAEQRWGLGELIAELIDRLAKCIGTFAQGAPGILWNLNPDRRHARRLRLAKRGCCETKNKRRAENQARRKALNRLPCHAAECGDKTHTAQPANGAD